MYKKSKIQLCFVGAFALGGCAEPCFDDGLLQEENDLEACQAMASISGGESETEGSSDSETDSAGGDCDDGVQNGDETDIDCGGSCSDRCGDGDGCGIDEDCQSGSCDETQGTCDPGTGGGDCDDGSQGGDETDVDCGGSCGATCEDGESCNDNSDCVSNTCTDAGVCGGSCDDGVQNQDETDVDCGNTCGPTCEDGEGCDDDGDCVTDTCDEDAQLCVDPSCDDGMQGGDETDVDCGGSCGPTCDTDETCDGDGDCISNDCDDTSGTCQPGDGCTDGEMNQDETDVDCGGVCGSTCEIDEMCEDDTDCVSDNCGDNGTCESNPLWCEDADMDGFGDADACVTVPPGEDPPDGSVNNDNDCDDQSEFAFPGAAPNDSATECMEDKDGDDWGDTEPSGAGTTAGTDCDDDSATAASTFPGAAANDSATECMEDKDGDDWGDDDPSAAGTTAGTDCDDDSSNAADTFPGAAANDSATECMEDKDGDDWGDDDPSDPGTTVGTDCDDDTGAGANTFPGAAPNDSATECMEDKDDDDWGDDDPSDPGVVDGTDCDDDSATAASAFPGAAENEDPADACMKDEDGDGWGDDTPPAGVAAGSDCDEDGEPPCVLMVTQDGTGDDSYDQDLVSVLEGQGYEVTYVSDTAADLEDANGFTVIVISETAQSSDIGGTFEDALVPAIVLEGFIWDDMSMSDAGLTTATGDVDIVAVGDARAGGLAGTHSVISGGGSGLFYTQPPAAADAIASVSGSPADVVYFTFDQGAAMLGGFVAPRRRVGLGYDADQAAGAVSVLDDGQTLFEAALTWVVG